MTILNPTLDEKIERQRKAIEETTQRLKELTESRQRMVAYYERIKKEKEGK